MDIKQAKLNIIEAFYGIEAFVDLKENVPVTVKNVDDNASEFEAISQILDLDLWFITVIHQDTGHCWNPFTKSLQIFVGGIDYIMSPDNHHIVFSHERQYKKADIVRFIKNGY